MCFDLCVGTTSVNPTLNQTNNNNNIKTCVSRLGLVVKLGLVVRLGLVVKVWPSGKARPSGKAWPSGKA